MCDLFNGVKATGVRLVGTKNYALGTTNLLYSKL